MNLLASVQAYIRERVHQLEREEPPAIRSIEELEMVNTLCEGLQKQMPIFDKIVEDMSKPKAKG